MSKNAPLSPAVTLSLMLSLTLLFLCVDLVTQASTAIVFKEGHAFEVLSALLLAVAAGMWWYTGAVDMDGRQWHIPVILALMAMRELDFDKRFTSEGVLQLRLYSGPSPLWEKAIGLVVIALILICGWRLLTISLPRWWAGLRAGMVSSQLSGLAVLLMVVAKTLDGLDRKLAGFGIILSPELGRSSGRVEEILELVATMMLVQVLVYFLRDRHVSQTQAEALTQLAPYTASR